MDEGSDMRGSKRPEPAMPRLFLWKRDLCGMLGVRLRTLERIISAGEIPPPNRRLRGRPVWLAATIREWVENGGGVEKRDCA